MAIEGSFKGLYTFQEVADIYNMDNSTLRKQVRNNKLINEVEVKKFGKTWLITEQAVIEHFGADKLNEYKEKMNLEKEESKKKAKQLSKIEKENKEVNKANSKKGKKYDIGESKESTPKGSENNYDDHGDNLEVKSSFSFNK